MSVDQCITFEDAFVNTCSKKTVVLINDVSPDFIVETHDGFQCKNLVTPFSVKKKGNDLEICYKPTVHNERHIEYYKIIDKNEVKEVICVKGECKGPEIIISTKYLYFYNIRTKERNSATFELSNYSPYPVKFQFENDNVYGLFTVEPLSGEIPSNKFVFVKVSFRNKNPGAYYYQLVCVLLYHNPILVQLIAVNAPRKDISVVDHFRMFFKPLFGVCGFDRYMDDSYVDQDHKCVCKFSKNYIDFGSSRATNFKNVLTTVIKNTSSQCLAIRWDNLPENSIFSVTTDSNGLCPEEELNVECKFTPNKNDKFFCATLSGRGFLYADEAGRKAVENDEINSDPIYISLRVMGNSFPDTCVWMAQVKFSNSVITMPLCAPNVTVYNTFWMERLGQLPVVFKFIPPPKTCFKVKPIQGEIKDKHQIMVVKCCINEKQNVCITERWHVEFNGIKESELVFHFKASYEIPNIVIGDNNEVFFDNIYPTCQQFLQVPIKNLTNHCYGFRFLNNDLVKINPSSGNLECGEITEVEWCLTAQLDMPETFEVTMELTLRQYVDLHVGVPYEYKVVVHGKCSYSRLCTTPNDLNFEEMICEQEYRKTIHIYNFGTSEIHFALRYMDMFGNTGVSCIGLEPSKASLKPQQSTMVDIVICPQMRGYFRGCILYSIRLNEKSDVIVNNHDEIWPDSGIVCNVSYYSIYPTIQFVDIAQNNCGPLFGKMNIWEMMEIEMLNKKLKDISSHETHIHYMRVPDAEFKNNIKKDLIFTIENIFNVKALCKIRRKQVCDCNLVTIHTGISKKKKIFECPHRHLVKIDLYDEEIEPHAVTYMGVEMSYEMEGLQEICYEIILSHNRKINLLIHIRGLPRDAPFLSPYTYDFSLKMFNIFIGCKDPSVQVYWFYNNTKSTTKYKVDETDLKRINEYYGTSVLTSLNPEGFVEQKSYRPLIFHFKPIALDTIECKVPIHYGAKTLTLTFTGAGILFYMSPLSELAGAKFGRNYYIQPGTAVMLSTEYFLIVPLLTFTETTRLFFMKNVTKDREIAFSIEEFYIEDIASILIEPSKGILKPNATQCFCLRIRTQGKPCAMRLQVPIFLLNYTQLQKHVRTKEAFHKEAIKLQVECGYGDKSDHIPIPQTVITPQPKIFHRILSITLHTVSFVDRDFKVPLKYRLLQMASRELQCFSELALDQLFYRHTNIEKPIRQSWVKSPYQYEYNEHKSVQEKKRPNCRECGDCMVMEEDRYIMSRTLIEIMLRSVATSSQFQHIILSLKNQPDPYYNQFKMSLAARKEKSKQILNPAPMNLISATLTRLIEDGVMIHFGFPPIRCTHDKHASDSDIHGKQPSGVYTSKFLFLLSEL